MEFYAGTTLLSTDTAAPYLYGWSPTATGTVSLTVKATDSANAVTTSAAVSVTVNAAIAGPTVSITSPAANARVSINQATTITADATANGGRTITKVDFYVGGIFQGSDSTSPYSWTWTPSVAATSNLMAKATDSAGTFTNSAAVSVTVVAAPTVSITAPVANAQLAIGQVATLTATASAGATRTISKVEFYADATLLGSDTTSPFALSWTPSSNGPVSLSAKATDSAGVTTTSSAVAVTVVDADGIPAAFSFGAVNAVANTVTTSTSQTLTAFNMPIAITVSGGSYSINSGAFVTTNGTLNPGQTLRLRVTASATSGASQIVTLTAGGVAGTFTVTTN